MFLQRAQVRVEESLQQAIAQCQTSPRLAEAMAYSCLGGGKRIRAALVYAAAHACQAGPQQLDQIAAAVEALHAYSLIHDDLPAMDDDDLRRGKPTSHIAFDEATAILAGDALHSLAFELLAACAGEYISSKQALQMVQALGQAAGAKGMVAGQMLDMAAERQAVELPALELLHTHKTGALINASIQLGALAAGDVSQQQLTALQTYGQAVGLAFQVQDDILDIESDSATLGKLQGADLARGKSTYPSLLGMEAAKELAQELLEKALLSLDIFAERAVYLEYLARLIVTRKS
ncbi:MAG: polyprenyl synthetase family protein [Gammaproteobacteria bacterium]|jgi:geranylgeranyl pyrophosphate synthase|nr:polyprenyl synthetase family protein [Gammaproteobacteria bacterium]